MEKTDHILNSKTGRKLALDIHYKKDGNQKPILLFAHGFKGFKDWGYWNILAEKFAEAGYVFIKFNFSFNGTTVEKLDEFDDLEAFGQNTFSKELLDIQAVLDWTHKEKSVKKEADLNNLTLIGHSRGGAISAIAAAEDTRIHRLITWAAVDQLNYMWNNKQDLLERWAREGVYSILNGRTKQEMPLNWTLVEDFEENKERFDTEERLKDFKKPMCIIHGKADKAVHAVAAQNLHLWNPKAEMYLIDGADHVFGGKHPYSESYLPLHAQVLLGRSLYFLEEIGA